MSERVCPACGGEKTIVDYEVDEYDRGTCLTERKCDRCNGTGKIRTN